MKRTVMNLVLLLIAVCAFAQAPDWQWAAKSGGTNWDGGIGITIDDAGNSYVTGSFCETATFGSYSLTRSGYYDIFVAKMDAIGNCLWAANAGGTDLDEGIGITIDDEGKCYVTGNFLVTATFGSYTLTSNGSLDIFVAKMDENGNWIWASQAGGTGQDRVGHGISIDDAGNIYVTGGFRETATFGSYSLTSNGSLDIFVAMMDADGTWQWATRAGGTSNDDGEAITIDDEGKCYVTGHFQGTATFGSYSLTSSGTYDIFVAKMDANGNWQWATKAGGSDCDEGIAITIDEDENTYVTGYFEGTATFGSHSITSNGDGDIYVAKMNTDGNWQWANQAGGAGGIEEEFGYGITIDNVGSCYITGEFRGTATFGSYSIISNGGEDIFVAKIDANGNWLWSDKAGGTYNDDKGKGITIDDAGNIYVTGGFRETATFGSHSLTSSGERDIFVAKLYSSVFAENEIIPTEIQLSNYPNPFNPATKIHYSIKEKSNVRIDVYNLKGQLVKLLINGQQNAGDHSVIWNGKDDNGNKVSSGIYFYKLNVNGEEKAVSKCVLLK